MRSTFLPVAIAFMVFLGPARAQEASGFPKKFHGVWTDSAMTCDLYKNHPRTLSKENDWIRIMPQEVSGSTPGRFLRMTDASTAQASDYTNQNITMDYMLRKDGFLDGRVTGARASMIYVRCR